MSNEEQEGNKKPDVFPSEEEIKKANQDTPEVNNPSTEGTPSPDEHKAEKEMEAQKEMERRRQEELKKAQAQQTQNQSQFDPQNYGQAPPQQRTMGEPHTPLEDSTTKERMEKGEYNEYAKEKNDELPAGDYIGLPSDGKIYKHGKDRIRVAYLTAEDENILTSPNLLESGEFLRVLLNKKIIDEDIHYEDLHVGDRNAVLIWLRATGYGPEYPVVLQDPKTEEEFERTIDLQDLKTKELKVEPDEEGLFYMKLPVSGSEIKFKLLTIADVEDIEAQVKHETDVLGYKVDNTITYTLMKHIIEADGRRDRAYIHHFVNNLRVGDSRALRKYVDEIEPGIDLNITVWTPGGESMTTFLPIGPQFFWPDF